MCRVKSSRARRCTVRAGCIVFLGSYLVACSEDSTGSETVAWSTTADTYRGENGKRFSYVCPAGGTAFPVWGTDLYTDDSSVCTAAVHAGKITLAGGGTATFEIRPGAATYPASNRNGIQSGNWDTWLGSFVFP